MTRTTSSLATPPESSLHVPPRSLEGMSRYQIDGNGDRSTRVPDGVLVPGP